jgi:hypothetical protein
MPIVDITYANRSVVRISTSPYDVTVSLLSLSRISSHD